MSTLLRYILLFAALVSVNAISAQDLEQVPLTFIDWDCIAADTVAPVYSEVVPLESDYRLNDYSVTLEYPTWAPLTEKEKALAQKYSYLISDSISVTHFITRDRGKGLLNFSFVPIVSRNGCLEKLVSVQIMINPLPKRDIEALARSLAAGTGDKYAKHSVLSSGTWRKIYVTEDGMYRLSPSTLKSMGFADASKVRVYGYGGHQLGQILYPKTDIDDLNEIPLYEAADGSLLFWGNGLVSWSGDVRTFNAYANKAVYFVTSADSEHQPIAEEEAYTGTATKTVSTCRAHSLYEKDNYALYTAGRNLLDGSVYTGSASRTYRFSDINSKGDEKLTVVFASNGSATLKIGVNDELLTSAAIAAPSGYTKYTVCEKKNMDVSKYSDESGTWRVTLSAVCGGSGVTAALDYIALSYNSPITTSNGYVLFGGGYSGNVCFSDISSGTSSTDGLKVMRLGNWGQPVSLVPTKSDDGGRSFVTNDAAYSFVAFDPTYSFPEPEVGAVVANQDLHGLDSIDMVIIVPASDKFTSDAQRLAEAHRKYQGIRCAVVRADQVYNEFSSGTQDATAYRRLLKMLYDRGAVEGIQPRWLLLFGDCAWDNRMRSSAWSKYSQDDYLLCNESEISNSDVNSYCWEDYFGLMDDGEGGEPATEVSDIGVGRFPATSVAQAKAMADKAIAYISNADAGEWRNRVVFIGDDDTKKDGETAVQDNTQMENANKTADLLMDDTTGKYNALNIRKIMLDSYERVSTSVGYRFPNVTSLIKQYSEDGTVMFNYTGHAAEYILSNEHVIELSNFRTWEYSRLPLWFTAACITQPFDTQDENLGETAMRNEKGGALAFIGTTHTVYSEQNYYLNTAFTQKLFDMDSSGRRYSIGEALRLAKAYVIDKHGDRSVNKLQYCLMGDPAIVLGNPTNKVVLDSINGEVITGVQQVKAASKVRFSGHVENSLKSTLQNFNGKLAYRLYDCIDSLQTRGNITSDKKMSYRAWNSLILNGETFVVNGKYSFEVTIPRDIKYKNQPGRLEFFAVADDDSIMANGKCQDFLVGGVSHELDKDSIGPDIIVMSLNDNCMDGCVVNSTPTFYAQLYDQAGVQYSGNGVGHDLTLVIDNDPSQTYNLNGYFTPDTETFGSGEVYYTIPELSEGSHNLTFRAWDMLNNDSVRSLNFVVGSDLQPQMSMRVKQDVATGLPTFCINYNYPGLASRFTVEVYSIAGQKVYSQSVLASGDKSGNLELTWNGYSSGGSKANDGLYAARVTVEYNGKTDKREKKFLLWGNN